MCSRLFTVIRYDDHAYDDHTRIPHEFVVVQTCRTCLNHRALEGTSLIWQFLMISGWINPIKPAWTTEIFRGQALCDNFAWVRGGSNLFGIPYQTCLNHQTLKRTRTIHKFLMSLGWFNPTKPASAAELFREQGSYHNFSWVQVGSTIPNLLEPLSSLGNKHYTIISHEFGVVQRYWTCFRHRALERRRIIQYFFMY